MHRMLSSKFYLFTACTIHVLVESVYADYTVIAELTSVANFSQTERLSTRNCCNPQCNSPCNVFFLLCLRRDGFSGVDHSCPLGEILAPAPLQSSELYLSETFTGSWEGQGLIAISIFIFHSATGRFGSAVGPTAAQTIIDHIFADKVPLVPSSPPTFPATFQGFNTTLVASFQVTCASNFYGSECNLECEHRNDSLGHYSCDPVTGARVCLEGYQEVITNCTLCQPRTGCSSVGGFCIDPGECLCLDGFSGESCSIEVLSSPTNATSSGFFAASVTSEASSMLSNAISTEGLHTVSSALPASLSTNMRPTNTLPTPSTLSSHFSSQHLRPSSQPPSHAVPSSTFDQLEASSQASVFSSAFIMPSEISTPSQVITNLLSASNSVLFTDNSVMTPALGPSQDRSEGKLLYIIFGSVGGALLLIITVTMIIMSIFLALHIHKKNEKKRKRRKLEHIYIDVVANIETVGSVSIPSTPVSTSENIYAAVIPRAEREKQASFSFEFLDDRRSLPKATFTTFMTDSGIVCQEASEHGSTRTLSASGQLDHEYAVLECEDLTSEGRPREHMDTELLGTIQRTLSQSVKKQRHVLESISDSDFTLSISTDAAEVEDDGVYYNTYAGDMGENSSLESVSSCPSSDSEDK